MDITKFKPGLKSLASDGPVIATKIEPVHPYRDGRVVNDEIIGRKITVVLPSTNFEVLDVKVSSPIDELSPLLKTANYLNPVRVDFDNFESSIYVFKDKETGQVRAGISAKATAVRLVDDVIDF